jgi:hypothetical protein
MKSAFLWTKPYAHQQVADSAIHFKNLQDKAIAVLTLSPQGIEQYY